MYELERKTPIVQRGRSKSVGKNLRLVERDFLVLRFILEMKFCSAEHIWERFYRYADGTDGTIKYTQNRLSRLRRGEYLNSHYTYDGPVRYYTATPKAFDLVLNHFDLREKDMPEPSKAIDMRSFTHDKGLVWLRIFWENMGLIDAFSWDSEGCIKRRTLFGLKPEATREAIQDKTWPDASVRFKGDGSHGAYALEFEHSVKGPDRRQEKIESYWRESGENVRRAKLFIYSNPQVERAYVESFSEFFGKAANGKYHFGHEKKVSELGELFLGQVFMVANYSEVREKYEKSLAEKDRKVLELGAICSVEPRFLEIREKVKVMLLKDQKEKALEQEKHNELVRKHEIEEQQRLEKIERQRIEEEEEWQKKGMLGRIFS